MSILLKKTLRLFLDSIGRRDEYEYYLQRFQAKHEGGFAIICPENEGFADFARVVAFDIEFLLHLGLDPVILLTGEEAPAMATLLLAHTSHIRDVVVDPAALSRAEGYQRVLDAMSDSRAKQQVTALVMAQSTREEALDLLVPGISRRVHLLRAAGPLRDASGEPLTYYHTQYPDRIKLHPDDGALAAQADRLLDRISGAHVSVASPLSLLQELFTVRGAGCVIRRGTQISRYDSLKQLDQARLVGLLEQSFGKPLTDPSCLERIDTFYVEKDYRGAAMLERHPHGVYLSKFAVSQAARGEGLAQELWREITGHHPSVFWRARASNPVNQWYEKQADGSHRTTTWRIYWRGVAPANLPAIIAYAGSRSEDFTAAPETA